MRRVALAAAVLGLLVTTTGCGHSTATDPGRATRTLVVTLPGVTWSEVRAQRPPHLLDFVDHAAVGAVSTRLGRTLASTTTGYLTMGAGTRAVLPADDTGVALDPTEQVGGVPASDLVERRLGRPADAIAYIPVGAAIDANERSLFAAEPGLLGDRLAAGGVRRAVIANADSAEGFPSDQPPPDGAYSRGAVTALMDHDGLVPDGSVSRKLLVEDPGAAFGRRLDHPAVLAAFDRVWKQPGRSVVVVEGSDLARASAYRLRADPEQAAALRARALHDTDELLGALLARVDPRTDAVLVVAPVAADGLGVVALQAPRATGGYLRSASTRRDGYLNLADVTPTVLALAGQPAPSDIEGRPASVAPAHGDRLARLAGEAADAAVRDQRLPLVVTLIIAALALLVLATALADRLPAPLRRALRPAALGALGLVPATYLAGRVAATWTSGAAFAAVVVGGAAVLGGVATAIDRRRPGSGLLVALAAILAVIAVDVVAGAPLQVNAVFGYSMAVAGRYTGLGNLAFALFSSAAVCFAVELHDRGQRPALATVAGVLAGAVVVDGLPMLGADAGGTLALVPAAVLTVIALADRRITWRQVALALGAGGAVLVVLGVVDTAQPSGSKTHLARLAGDAASGRFDLVATTLARRVDASFGGPGPLVALVVVTIVGLAVAQAVAVSYGLMGPDAPRRARAPSSRALAWGLGTVAVVGLVANDSSIAVPATMLIVIVPVLVLRHLDGRDRLGQVAS